MIKTNVVQLGVKREKRFPPLRNENQKEWDKFVNEIHSSPSDRPTNHGERKKGTEKRKVEAESEQVEAENAISSPPPSLIDYQPASKIPASFPPARPVFSLISVTKFVPRPTA